MRLIYNFFLIFVSILVLSSCVLHPSFPFVCFRKDCRGSMFSARKDSGGKRSMKQKMKIVLAKVNAKKRKRQNQTINISKIKFDQFLIDSLLADKLGGKETIKVILYFKKALVETKQEKDSVYLNSSFLMLSKNDKMLINYYVTKCQLKNIKEVYITAISINKESEEQINKLAVMKVKRVAHYFIKIGVKKPRIKMNSKKNEKERGE
jgi:hypothetical protein